MSTEFSTASLAICVVICVVMVNTEGSVSGEASHCGLPGMDLDSDKHKLAEPRKEIEEEYPGQSTCVVVVDVSTEEVVKGMAPDTEMQFRIPQCGKQRLAFKARPLPSLATRLTINLQSALLCYNFAAKQMPIAPGTGGT